MRKYISLAALCFMMTPAYAGEITSLQAESIQIGAFRGIVYYTSENDGYRLVATIAQGETGLPVRFEATLMDGQKAVISVPGNPGEKSLEVKVSRAGDKLVVDGAQMAKINGEEGEVEIAATAK